jgi:hypothetical protein
MASESSNLETKIVKALFPRLLTERNHFSFFDLVGRVSSSGDC